MNRFLKYGLIMGALTCLAYLLVFFTNKAQLFSSLFYWGNMVFMVVLLIYLMMRERRLNGGKLEYGDRLKTCVLTLIIGTTMVFVLQAIFYKSDADYRALFLDNQINTSTNMTKFFSTMNEDLNKYDIEEMKIELNEQMSGSVMIDPFSESTIFLTYFNVMIFTLVYALICALFVGEEKMSIRERLRRIDL